MLGVVTRARVAAVASVVFVAGSLLTLAVFDARFADLGREEFQSLTTGPVFVAAIVASVAVGATLLARRPEHPVGWLFAALAAAICVTGVSEAYAAYGLFARPGSLPGAGGMAVVASSSFIFWLIVLALVCSLTPDGRHLSPRWRRASKVMMASGLVWFGLKLIAPGPLESPFESVDNPWAVTSVDLDALRLPAAMLNNVLVLIAGISVVVRFRRAEGDVRRQLLWMAVAAVPTPVLMAVVPLAQDAGNDAVADLAAAGLVVLLPVGAGLAVSRYHLYDVDRILSRAVSYLIVSALVVATYATAVFVVAGAVGQAADRSPTATTVATLVAAAVARPVYITVRDALDRRFHRRRYEALRQVRAYIGDPGGGDRRVEGVLRDAVGDRTLRVAYWEGGSARWVSEDGAPTSVGLDPLIVERGGRVIAAITSECDDPATLTAAAQEAAPELDNARLRAAVAVQLEEVRASRERIAETQIQERRRIERDLHDGAQQRLLGTAAQMQAALVNGSTDHLRAALELGVRESRTAVADLRALANGLHPAVLEDYGLAAALEDLATRIPVSLDVRDRHRRYSPTVEATMWFVACEAVTNATKHAAPRGICITLDQLDDRLRLIVEDDGAGGADADGTGLRGLADRVEAAGGRLTLSSPPGAGTRVEAELPCGS